MKIKIFMKEKNHYWFSYQPYYLLLSGTTLINITLIAWTRYNLVTCQKIILPKHGWKIRLAIASSWILPALCLLPPLTRVWGGFDYVPILVTCNLLLDKDSKSFKLVLLVTRAVIPCILCAICYTSIYKTTLK